MSNVFGVDKVYGTLSLCKAKPENRGRGRCHHADHLELSESEAMPEKIQKLNEEKLSEYFNPLKSEKAKDDFPEDVTPNHISSHKGGLALNRSEFDEANLELSESFPEENWAAIQDFYKVFNTRLTDGRIQLLFDDSVENIHSYLNSDEPTAKKVRQFLGKEVDLKTFSELLVHNVRSMTQSFSWTPRKPESIRRIVLTSVANDMTKERYVASVLFFGGRCCYCNQVLTRGVSSSQATGEHITPLAPDNPGNPPGTTRYGNMALCCRACNSERGNEHLETWMKRTNRVPDHLKEPSLNRIKTFRRFALYRDFNEKDGEIISSSVKALHSFVQNERQEARNKNEEIDAKKVTDKVKITIHDLSTYLRQG